MGKAQNNQKEGNVAAMPEKCRAEKCAHKVEKMGFCPEHYTWFKEGLLTKQGQRPPDFDKKYQTYLRRHPKAA